MLTAFALLFCTLLPLITHGETIIRTHQAGGTTFTETYSLEKGFSEDSTAAYLQTLQIISQRDSRFATDDFRYIYKEPFEKNGCGPASLHNGLSATLGIEDPQTSVEILTELMVLLAPMHNPIENRLNYNHVQELLAPDPDRYPALAVLMTKAAYTSYLGPTTANKVKKELEKAPDDSFLLGRININSSMGELLDIAKVLCEAGYPNAMIAVSGVSAGGNNSQTPFGQGNEGHFITYLVTAREFSEEGTVYVLDSFPRALRGERLNDIYTKRYYFAESNYLSGFRLTYDVTRVQPTVVMCTLNAASAAEIADLESRAAESRKAAKELRSLRIRFASYIKTYGTGTLMIRINDSDK